MVLAHQTLTLFGHVDIFGHYVQMDKNVIEKVIADNTNDVDASHSCNMRLYQRHVAFLSRKVSSSENV